MAVLRLAVLAAAAALATARRGPAAAAAAAPPGSDILHPQFHVGPAFNWMNDPNGPAYVAGMYHLFFQYNPSGAVWGNMSWGHAVSPDLVHWEHLPVALLPDSPYDDAGVFSGSITMVNGQPVISYTCVSSTVGQQQCQARPANASDPLLVEWVKDAGNPLIPQPAGTMGGNFRDPTTAWWDAAPGVWLMATGNAQPSGAVVQLFSSPDFKSWSYSNVLFALPGSGPGDMIECPDFFALPGSPGPLHVLKMSRGPDSYFLGAYDSSSRSFTPLAPGAGPQRLDYGNEVYASKSFWDPRAQRQVWWGWVQEEDGQGPQRGWQGMQTLPRQLSYDPATLGMNAAPLPELAKLRNATLASVTSPLLLPDGAQLLLSGASGQMLEIDAYFALAAGAGADMASEFGLLVRATPDAAVQTRIGLQYVPPGSATQAQNNTDHPGGDGWVFPMDPTAPEAANLARCNYACEVNATCLAWTYVRPGDGDVRCCLKVGVVPPAQPNPFCVSGVKGSSLTLQVNRTGSGSEGNIAPQGGLVPLPLVSGVPTPGEVVRLHVFVDHSIVESFVDGGRARVTTRLYPSGDLASQATNVGLYALGGQATLLNATVWSLGSIWA